MKINSNKTISRIFSAVLCIALIFSTVSIALADEVATSGTFTDNGNKEFTWEFDASTGVLTLGGTGAMTFSAAPAVPWAAYIDQITSVSIGSGITQLGRELFKAHKFVEITIPGTVTATQWGTFNACGKLKKVTIEEGFTTLADKTFQYCIELEELNLPSTLTKMGLDVVLGCTKFTELTLPWQVSINKGTFGKNDNDVKPAPATNIGHQINFTVYKGTPAETYVKNYYPDSLKEIVEKAVIATGDIGDASNTGLKWTFYHNNELVISRNKDANGAYIGTGKMPDYAETADQPWNAYRGSITSIEIGDGITYIGNRNFQECTKATSVTMADTVINMGQFVFNACSSITSMTLSKNLRTCGQGILNNVRNLKEIIIPSKLDLRANVFTKTASDIVIKVYKDSIAHNNFPDGIITGVQNTDGSTGNTRTITLLEGESGTDGDLTWTYAPATKTLTISGNGAMTDWKTQTEYLADADTSNDDSAVHSLDALHINQRGWDAYKNTAENIVIGNGVTKVGQYAFMQFGKVDALEFESGSQLNSIDKFAFSDTALANVVIPEGTEVIGAYAFRGKADEANQTLESITIPATVTTIDPTIIERQANAVVYCYPNSTAHQVAYTNKFNYRLIGADYYIENYDTETKKAEILNSTENSKAAAVIFASYDSNNKLTSVSLVLDTALNVGLNTVTAGENFVPSNEGSVKVMVWENMQNLRPLAGSY